MATTAIVQDPTIRPTREFLERLMKGYGPLDFTVRFWDGSTWGPEGGKASRFTLAFKHAGAARRMFTPPPQLTMAEAYFFDDIDIEGDLEAYWDLVHHWMLRRQAATIPQLLKLRWAIYKLPTGGGQQAGVKGVELSGQAYTPERNRQAISYHYDISNEFYTLFLDETMLYSCGYFTDPDNSLHQCQVNKLDHICHKLRLKAGERLLDIGCGWGGMVIHAAQKYGARTVGITLSTKQKEWADEKIKRLGLQDRCKVELRDYRELNEPEGFDKMSAIGCMEHVGEVMLPAYFSQAFKLLKPGGVFLNHAIARGGTAPRIPRPNFVHKYVFPDGQLEPINIPIRAAETIGFEVRDVESLRDHYIRTLRHWLRRLEENADRARQLTSDAIYRVYRLYIAGSIYGFKVGRFNLYQTLLLKPTPGASALPLTRHDWYV